MELLVGHKAPNFIAKAVMEDNMIDHEFNLMDYAKGYKCVLFFYPLDFTFVCPSEIIAFNNRLGEFASRNTRIVGASIDSHFTHIAWKKMSYNDGGIGQVNFPLIADIKREAAMAYRVLNRDGISLRGTFLIDEDFVLRHMLVNDLPLGRNVDETLRTIDALDHHNQYGEVCPAGWNKGRDGMTATQEGVADYLASNADRL